jgi:hypothetical protein
MMQRQITQDLLALGSEREQHVATVFSGARSTDVSGLDQAVHEFDRTVMLDLQTLSEFSDRGPHVSGEAFDTEHQLVLPGFQARGTGRLFTEGKKAAYLITQLRQ